MDDTSNVKILCNEFVWAHWPGSMTLDEAEAAAVAIFELLAEAKRTHAARTTAAKEV